MILSVLPSSGPGCDKVGAGGLLGSLGGDGV